MGGHEKISVVNHLKINQIIRWLQKGLTETNNEIKQEVKSWMFGQTFRKDTKKRETEEL